MSESRSLTYEDRKQIEKLIDQGLTNRDLALHLGVNLYAIKNEFSRSGGRIGYNAEKAQAMHEQRKNNVFLSHTFRKKPIELLTLEDRKKIESYKSSKLSGRQIGDLIGKHGNVINREFRLFPTREEYDAEKAQDLYEKTKKEKYDKLRSIRLQNNTVLYPVKPDLLIDKDIDTNFVTAPKSKPVVETPSYIPKIPLKIWVDRYEEECAPKRVYWKKEVKYFEFWLRAFGDKIAVDISPLEIESMADELLKKQSSKIKTQNISYETRRKYLLMLSSLYTTAIKDWKWATFNPLSCVDMTRKGKKGYQVYTHEFTETHQNLRKEFHDSVLEKIKELRITNREAARKANVSLSILQRALNVNHNVTLNVLCRFAKHMA